MKKILFVCLMAALGLGTGSAAAKDAKKASTVTTVFKTDIDCEHCAKRIMDNIPFEKGVKDVKVDVPSKEVTACKENCCKKGDCDKKCCAAACDKKCADCPAAKK